MKQQVAGLAQSLAHSREPTGAVLVLTFPSFSVSIFACLFASVST